MVELSGISCVGCAEYVEFDLVNWVGQFVLGKMGWMTWTERVDLGMLGSLGWLW